MFRKVCLLIAIIAASSANVSKADDFLLAQLYGSGVHAYNSGDYMTAYRELTSAIQGGTIDPRAYYFRGLTFLRLGRPQEAVADFKKGADMETGDSNDVFPVSISLARIQGPDRDMLERYREAARVTAHQRQEMERQARYEQRIEAEATVLRKVQPTELTPPPDSSEQTPAAGKSDDPFAEPKPVPSQQPEVPKPNEPPKSDDPFGAAPAKGQPAPAADAKPAEKPKPAPANDPNPFGPAPNSKAPPAGDKPQPVPAGKPAADSKSKPAPVDDNPFK